jgi:phosphopantetheinyl transferase
MRRIFADRLPSGFFAAIGSQGDPIPESGLFPDEERRLASFGLARRRAEFVLGRSLIRWLAAETLRTSSPVEICVRENGSLFLPESGYHVSLAHSRDSAVAILGPTQVGVDLEVIRTRDPRLLDRLLTDTERGRLARFIGVDDAAPIVLWTIKEAVLKASGTGLRAGLRSIEVCSVSEREATVRDGEQLWRVHIARMDDLCLSVALASERFVPSSE